MKLIILLALLLSSACSAQEAPPVPTPAPIPTPNVTNPTTPTTPQVLVDCKYKYDSSYNVVFLESNKTEYSPPNLPELTVYRITDIKGNNWAINEYDWENYTCTYTPIPKG